MENIKTSHLIYFFILLFPLSNYLFPFFIYGNEISIRIYDEGTFGIPPTHVISDTSFNPVDNHIFSNKGIYSIGKAQGSVYVIDPKSIYISLLYLLIFFLISFFTFTFKNKNLSYDIEFLKDKKKKYFQMLFFFFISIIVINYFELTNISNLFDNLLIISKIFLLFFICLLIFKSKTKKKLIFYIFFLIVIISYIINLRSEINLPITYNLIFNAYFLSFILCIFLALKKKLTFLNLIIIGIVGIVLILGSFLWKENARSYSNYNWSKLSKKIDINSINKPFGSSKIIASVLNAPISRINKLDQFSYIVESKENHELLLGKSYLPLLTKFIPRQFWKNKPTEVFGNKYGREYKLIPPYDVTTSVGASTLIEAYINFRFLGIALLGIFYGMIYRILNYYIYKNKEKNNYLSFLLATIALFISITSESNLSSGLGGALQMIFLGIIYNIFLKIWKKGVKKYET